MRLTAKSSTVSCPLISNSTYTVLGQNTESRRRRGPPRSWFEDISFSSLMDHPIQYANLEQVRYPLVHNLTTEIIALSLLASLAPQKLELRARFHPLLNDSLSQAPAHIDHGTHNGGVSGSAVISCAKEWWSFNASDGKRRK
jgi:hypothetical protein